MKVTNTSHGPSRLTRVVWLGLGVFFAALTARVLLWEASGIQDLTPEHLLTIGALVGAISSGVYFTPMLKAMKLGNALGLGIAFTAATVYCLIGSAGRGDEKTFEKNAEVRQHNADRARANRSLDEAKTRYQAALEAEVDECASGSGGRCKARRQTTERMRIEREAAEINLRALPPEGRENGKLKRAADIIAFYRGVDAAVAERGLALIWPFIPPLVCELLTIVFLHLGFAGAATTVPVARKLAEPAQLPQETVETERRPRKPSGGNRPGRGLTKEETERYVVTELALGRSLPSQDFLADKAGVGKGTVSKWMTEWEQRGLVSRTRAGKCKMIEAA